MVETIELNNAEIIPLLPSNMRPKSLLFSEGMPCHQVEIIDTKIETLLTKIKRGNWSENLYANISDLERIKRYRNADGSYKNDFSEAEFISWIELIEKNTVICGMQNKNLGKGVFVPPGKKLPAGTFIVSSGLIKLDPTKEELETKVHCSALQDLDSMDKKIIGMIDPNKIGGVLDLINHAPTRDELENFTFKKASIKSMVATANLRSVIRFYNGYAVMGLQVDQDIEGGSFGKQLLWSYAYPWEYVEKDGSHLSNKILLLFDNRDDHNGEAIDPSQYDLKEISIFIDAGEPLVKKIALITRWELLESSPTANIVISPEDPYTSKQSNHIESLIQYGFLQAYLKKNPLADRIILKIPKYIVEDSSNDEFS